MILAFISLVALTQAPSFAQTVTVDFDLWDADHDGALTAVEIDQAALNPKFHGADAAALAALHSWLAAAKDPAPKLTKQWFLDYKPVPLRIVRGTPGAEAKAERKAYSASPDSLQSSFSAALKRISKMREVNLYEGPGPELTDIRQGALGDCYMLAPLGAMVHRNPDDVRNMIKMNPDGYTIDFGDGKEVKITPLTDAELAMGGSTTREGLWIRVLEKAFGSRKFAEGEVKIARDGMNGGSPGAAGRAYTGHRFDSIALIGDFKKQVADDQLTPRLAKLREDLSSALTDHRLVLASTPSRDMPVSINGKHAYAVFGFDATADTITLWNPHGNDFKPKGPEGPEFGYARSNGVFSMPLSMFARAFGRIFFERKD